MSSPNRYDNWQNRHERKQKKAVKRFVYTCLALLVALAGVEATLLHGPNGALLTGFVAIYIIAVILYLEHRT